MGKKSMVDARVRNVVYQNKAEQKKPENNSSIKQKAVSIWNKVEAWAKKNI